MEDDGDRQLFNELEECSAGEVRRMAVDLQSERIKQLQRAASSFKSGNLTGRSCAAFYSDEGQALAPKIAQLNRVAAEKIYAEKNPKGLHCNKLDLHHLTVAEAQTITKAFLELHKSSTVQIVTGRGNHSSDGSCKLSTAIWNLLRSEKRNFSFDGIATFTINP